MWETWVQSLGWEDLLEKGKYSLQSSGLENSVDHMVHGVAKTWTWLSNFHFHFHTNWGKKFMELGMFSYLKNVT